ncbi:hypothetical protein HanIR_Chr15g0753341 [Helianthus annuus]|nr:hypothetical protein HanIR_Chr15g0753341 [Helianthus annuus]
MVLFCKVVERMLCLWPHIPTTIFVHSSFLIYLVFLLLKYSVTIPTTLVESFFPTN